MFSHLQSHLRGSTYKDLARVRDSLARFASHESAKSQFLLLNFREKTRQSIKLNLRYCSPYSARKVEGTTSE